MSDYVEKAELDERIAEYLKENLSIEIHTSIENYWDYGTSDGCKRVQTEVKLYLGGVLISSDTASDYN